MTNTDPTRDRKDPMTPPDLDLLAVDHAFAEADYRSRRRRRDRLERERRRDRLAAGVVVALAAACVYLGAGGPAWP